MNKYPKITFYSNANTQKKEKFVITSEFIQNVLKTLKNKGTTGDALLIHLMYTLKLRTGGVRLIKFEDVKNQEQPTIKVYRSKISNSKQTQISQDLYNEIKYYEGYLIQKGKYDKFIRQITVSEQVVGHFKFADSESTILK